MRMYGHLAGGYIAAQLVADRLPVEGNEKTALVIIGAVAGILPDLDILYYFYEKKSFAVADDFYHHKWITHTFPFYFALAFLIYLAGLLAGSTFTKQAALLFVVCTSVHLLLDMVATGDGINVLWPFYKPATPEEPMFGFKLMGVHGTEWLERYKNSPYIYIERAIILVAIIMLGLRVPRSAGGATFAMTWFIDDYPVGIQVLHFVLTIAYGIMLAVIALHTLILLAAISRQLVGKLPAAASEDGANVESVRTDSLGNLFKTHLPFNLLLSIVSLVGAIVIIAALSFEVDGEPLRTETKLGFVTFAVVIIPYLWSFYTATTAGVFGGTLGAALGLSLFAWMTQLDWLANAPLLGALNVLSYLSGWLGGVVGQPQIREAMVANVYEIDVKDKKLDDLAGTIFANANRTIAESMNTFSGKPAQHRSPDYNFTLAYTGPGKGTLASLISYRREVEWCVARHPILEALGWPIEDPGENPRRISTIADEGFNFLQHMVSRLIMVTPQRDDDPENCNECTIQLIVLSYRETPSILWIDDAVQSYSELLHENLLEKLSDMKPKSTTATLMNWQKPRLEQYAKNTLVARDWASEDTPNLQLSPTFQVPTYLVSEFTGAKTFWSQMLGRRPIMIAFLVEQIILASLLNRLTGGFDQLLDHLPW